MPSRRFAPRGAQKATLFLATSFCLFASSPAHAQTVDAATKLACVEASDKAQQLRVAGKLVAAREALNACVVDKCPSVVREACSQWLGEVSASLPTIVIGATEADGRDLLDLKVSIDGTLVTEHLDGRAVPIDPGRHKMRYEKAGGAVVEEEILVGQGTKNRAVSVVFPGASPVVAPIVVPPPVVTESGQPLPPKRASAANTTAGIVFAALGAGALGTALALDLSATSDINSLRASKCAPNCSSSRVNSDTVDYDIAAVGLGVGIAALGVATYVFIAHPFGTRAGEAKTGKALGPHFQVLPSPHGSSLAFAF